jgi:hypothetical protein
MQRRFFSCLAILAIAFNALWPLLANAAPVTLDSTICTTDKAAQSAQSVPGKRIPASSSLPHCPFCLGVSDATPGLASAPFTFYERIAATFSAAIAGTAGAAVLNYSSAAPRGPPALP